MALQAYNWGVSWHHLMLWAPSPLVKLLCSHAQCLLSLFFGEKKILNLTDCICGHFSDNCSIAVHRGSANGLVTFSQGDPHAGLIEWFLASAVFFCAVSDTSSGLCRRGQYGITSQINYLFCESLEFITLYFHWVQGYGYMNKLLWDKVGCTFKKYQLPHGTCLIACFYSWKFWGYLR